MISQQYYRYEDIEDGPLLDKVNLQVQEICIFLQSRIDEIKRPSKEIEDMLKLNSTLLEQISIILLLNLLKF